MSTGPGECQGRRGIVVDTDDVAIHSGAVQVRAPWGSDVPAFLRISVSGKVGSGVITAGPPRPPRRTFWPWLLRRPRPALPLAPPARPGLPGLPGRP